MKHQILIVKHWLGVWYSRCFNVQPEKAKTQTGVAVTGFLFALVIGELAIEVANQLLPVFQEPSSSSGSATLYESEILSVARFAEVLRSRYVTLMHLLVAITLTVTSAIGYYTSVNLPKLRVRFFNKPFIQFALDVMMVFVYFLLIKVAETSLSDADARPEVYLVFLSFILYTLWDMVSFKLSRDYNAQKALREDQDFIRQDSRRNYGSRRWVTVGFAIATGILAVIVRIDGGSLSPSSVVFIDWSLIATLLLYRAAKSVVDHKIKTTRILTKPVAGDGREEARSALKTQESQ